MDYRIDPREAFYMSDEDYHAGMQELADYAEQEIFGVWFENEEFAS